MPVQYIQGIESAGLEQCAGAGSFLQSGFWGSFKARFNWNARSFLVDWGRCKTSLLLIRRRLPPAFSFAYIPWGPELPPDFPVDDRERSRLLVELAEALKSSLPGDTCFIRFDPPWFQEESPSQTDAGPVLFPPLLRAGADVQPPDTVIINLKGTEEEILAGMKPKGRYNTKLARKKEVEVRDAGEEGLTAFYSLLQTTSLRDGIAIHSQDYYRTLFSQAASYTAGESDARPVLRLYLASQGGEYLSAGIVLYWGKTSTYLYGASSDNKRNLMAPYALQFQAMIDAKAAGCLEYDLFGIPPGKDPDHPMAGLYRFKTNFGGKIIHRPGSWDYPYKPLLYRLFRSAETLRKRLRTAKKKRKHGSGEGE